ncbi:YraN family protein [Gilvimarinus sp. F26214L]|uniref:YraN family protein n=1 Tax=Gilvimarinus sp. DZF01 TaxID=3461371 RepID=UPI0040452A4A
MTASLTGQRAEREAEAFLCAKGLRLEERNFSCKLGEIDLIMRDGDTLVFAEVRYRTNPRFGSPAESVDYRKQQKIVRSAQYFMQRKRLVDAIPCRFDVVSITGGAPPQIQWIKDAF